MKISPLTKYIPAIQYCNILTRVLYKGGGGGGGEGGRAKGGNCPPPLDILCPPPPLEDIGVKNVKIRMIYLFIDYKK